MTDRYGALGRQDPNFSLEALYADPQRVVGPIRSIQVLPSSIVLANLSIGAATGCATAAFQVSGSAHITQTLGVGACPPASPSGLYVGTGSIAVVGTDPGGGSILRVGGGATFTASLHILAATVNTEWTANASYAVIGTDSAHQFKIITNSVERWLWDANGHQLANIDNIYDLGASGANRP